MKIIEDKPKLIYLKSCINDNKYLSKREKEEILKYVNTLDKPKDRKDYVVYLRAINKIRQMYLLGDLMTELKVI